MQYRTVNVIASVGGVSNNPARLDSVIIDNSKSAGRDVIIGTSPHRAKDDNPVQILSRENDVR